MASSINADNGVISGSSGLKSTADASGVLALQSNGTTGLTLNTSLAVGVGSSPSYGTSGQVLTSAGNAAPPTWATPSTAPGVTNYSNQSADVTLTSANANYLLSFTLANDITVTMPDATTLTSAKNFEIKNNSATYGIYVNDAAGNYIFSIPPQTNMRFWTTSVATAAGAWVTGSLPLPYLTTGYTTDIPAAATMQNTPDSTATLSATQAVMLFGYLNGMYAVVVTNTAGVISYGTPTYFAQAYSGGYTASVAALTSTSGIVVYPESNSSGYYLAVGFTISGTTISFGAPSNTNSTLGSSTFETSISALSSTTAVFAFATTSTSIRAVVLTLSGGAVSAGAEAVPGTSKFTNALFQVAALSSTSFVLGYSNSVSTYLSYVFAGTISGTTITFGTVQQSTASAGNGTVVSALSSTSFIMGSIHSTGTKVTAGTVSGTTVTLGTPATASSANANAGSITALTSTTAIIVYDDNATIYGMLGRTASVSGTTVTMGASAYTVQAGGSSAQASYAGASVVPLQTIAVGTPNTSSVLMTVGNSASANYATRNQNLTVSGSVVTANTANAYAVSNNVFNNDPAQRAAAISSTQLVRVTVLASADGTAGKLVARLYGVSGSTFTLQSSITVATDYASSGVVYAVFPISATLVCVLYASSTNTMMANTISISGTSMTLNTSLTVDAASTFRNPSGVMLSSSLLLISYYDYAAFNYKYRTLSLSGTTLTANTAITSSDGSGTTYASSMVALSSTLVAGIRVAFTSASYYATVFGIAVSGTTVTLKTTLNQTNIYNGTIPYSVTALSSSRAMFTYPFGNSGGGYSIPYYLQIYVVDFAANGQGVIAYSTTYKNVSQPTNTIGACVAATSATSGMFFALPSGGSNQGPVMLGNWSITSGNVLLDFNNANSWTYATVGNISLHPLVTPSVGLQSAKQFALMASESTTTYSPASAQGITLRKYSVAGTVNS